MRELVRRRHLHGSVVGIAIERTEGLLVEVFQQQEHRLFSRLAEDDGAGAGASDGGRHAGSAIALVACGGASTAGGSCCLARRVRCARS
jgi:hypothetical protein